MRVFLLNHPVKDFFFTPQRAYPLALLYLATALKKNGQQVKIFDFLSGNKKTTLEVPEKFAYLKRYYKPNLSAFRLFSRYFCFGTNEAEFVGRVREFAPDAAGISASFSAYADSALQVAALIKKTDPKIAVIVGGRAATVWPRLFLKDKNVDFVLRGEGEETLPRFCQRLEFGGPGRVAGLCYRSGGRLKISNQIPFVKDLDGLPLPDRGFIDQNRYIFQGRVLVSLLASRGCGRGCTFCAVRERLRWRSPQNVVAELRDCFVRGARHFNFEDDNINLHPGFNQILDSIIAEFGGQAGISFMNGMLSLGLDKKTRDKLKTAGLTHIDLSLASCSAAHRLKLGRDENAKKVFQVSKDFSRRKIPATVHFIVGFPGQDFDSALADARVIADKPALLGPSIFYPVIESPSFAGLVREKLVDIKNYPAFRSSAASLDKFISRDRIFFLFYLCRIINFLKQSLDTLGVKKVRQGLCREKIPAEGAIGRTELSLFLMGRVLREGKIFRVQEKPNASAGQYQFFAEDFISDKDLFQAFKKLKVRSLLGRQIILGVKSCFL